MAMSVVIFKIPFLARKLSEFFKSKSASLAGKGLKVTLTMKTLQTQIKTHGTEIFRRSAIVGKVAPNLKLVDVKSEKLLKLLDFQKPGRPLIVNFGSCT
jgi:hypothetical protein